MPYKAVVLALGFFERGSKMASGRGRSREEFFDVEEAVRRIFNEEDKTLGIPSDEESDLDHELYDMDDDQR